MTAPRKVRVVVVDGHPLVSDNRTFLTCAACVRHFNSRRWR
jgi:hypothetical protein